MSGFLFSVDPFDFSLRLQPGRPISRELPRMKMLRTSNFCYFFKSFQRANVTLSAGRLYNKLMLFFSQLAWRRYQNPVLIPNPNPNKERNQCGTRLPRYASWGVESQVRNAREQNLSPPPEGTLKRLVPPPPHQEKAAKGRSPGSEGVAGYWIQSFNNIIICNKQIFVLQFWFSVFYMRMICEEFCIMPSCICNGFSTASKLSEKKKYPNSLFLRKSSGVQFWTKLNAWKL